MKNTMQWLTRCFCILVLISAKGCLQADPPSLSSEVNYLHDFTPINDDGSVHVVVEIPAGSNEKWEVDKVSGELYHEIAGDSLRMIAYLPYPANYGMIPGTWLPASLGGDDDPLDIFLLGPARPRGSVVKARLIGVLRMTDQGQQDDKLIAIDPKSWFSEVYSIMDLDSMFPGVTDILSTWMQHYKGSAVPVWVHGFDNAEIAYDILMQASSAYNELQETN